MARHIVGSRVTREAVPGPEMTEGQFKQAVTNMATDAARWRFLQTHFYSRIGDTPLHQWLETNLLTLGGLDNAIDIARALPNPKATGPAAK